MSTAKHTPEPWTAEEWTCHAKTSIRASGVYVAEFAATGRHTDEAIVDAARAVACVNACEGIKDPAAALRKARATLGTVVECSSDPVLAKLAAEALRELEAKP